MPSGFRVYPILAVALKEWALVTKGIKTGDSKRSSFITDFFELQFDPATLIIPSFRMVKARDCKQRFKSDLYEYRIISNTYYFEVYYTAVV